MTWFKKKTPQPIPLKPLGDRMPWYEFLFERVLPHPFRFAKDLLNPGGPSSTRLVVLSTCMCLNIECLTLTWARAKWKEPVSAELTIVIGVLSVLIGYVHNRSKNTEDKKTELVHKSSSVRVAERKPGRRAGEVD